MTDVKVYKYRAIAKGTLGRPYRFFKEDDIIESPVPLEHSALVDASIPKPKRSNVIVPYMTINGRVQRPDYAEASPTLSQDLKTKGVPPIKDAQYERGMEGVKRMEAHFDNMVQPPAAPEAQPQPSAVDPEVDNIKTGDVSGTGNQEVI